MGGGRRINAPLAEGVLDGLASMDAKLEIVLAMIAGMPKYDVQTGGQQDINGEVAEFWRTRGYKARMSEGGTLQIKPVTTLQLATLLLPFPQALIEAL